MCEQSKHENSFKSKKTGKKTFFKNATAYDQQFTTRNEAVFIRFYNRYFTVSDQTLNRIALPH